MYAGDLQIGNAIMKANFRSFDGVAARRCGRRVIGRLGYELDGIYFGSKSAFDPALAKSGPGHLAVAFLLDQVCKATPANTRPFPFRPDRWLYHFKRACSHLGLSSEYVVHSLRHGGATHLHFVDAVTIEDIKLRGRWKSLESAAHYIQSGRARELEMVVPQVVYDAGARAIADGLVGPLRDAHSHWLARR